MYFIKCFIIFALYKKFSDQKTKAQGLEMKRGKSLEIDMK